jgi:hypothetical protein
MTRPPLRQPITELLLLGPFPPADSTTPDNVRQYERLLARIDPPLTDEEAGELLSMFGADDYFGLAWTLVHLIETANSPIKSAPDSNANEWIRRLWKRAAASGRRERNLQ